MTEPIAAAGSGTAPPPATVFPRRSRRRHGNEPELIREPELLAAGERESTALLEAAPIAVGAAQVSVTEFEYGGADNESATVAPVVVAREPVILEPPELAASDLETSAYDEAKEEEKQRSGGLSLMRETAIIVVSALVVSYLIKSFLAQAFYIPSESMRDTLQVGDRVMVSRLVPRFLDVHHGDIVVFVDPGGWLPPYSAPDRGPLGNAITTGLTWVGLLPQDTGEHLIKRAIGLPGDHVKCCDTNGRVMINGVSIDEALYLRPGALPSQDPFEVTVPPDRLFVLGDNRQDSADSRYNQHQPYGGFVPIEKVVGTAFATVWPFSQAGWLRSPGSVFVGVPAPAEP